MRLQVWSIVAVIGLAARVTPVALAQRATQARTFVPPGVASTLTPCAPGRAAECPDGHAFPIGAPARGRGTGLNDVERRRWAPVASLILPGTGQALLHQDRFVAYLAMEAWAVLEYSNQLTEARRQQSRYRALARDVARTLYGPAYPDGTWAYYESMEHYLESGVFTRVPGGDVEPEIDESTYNGAMWLLARTTYWTDPSVAPSRPSPEYTAALNFYLNRAVRPDFRWSWRNAQLEQDLYVRTIRRANTAFHGARAALGAVLANHLLSAVDAFVSLRIEGLDGGATSGFAVRGRVPIR